MRPATAATAAQPSASAVRPPPAAPTLPPRRVCTQGSSRRARRVPGALPSDAGTASDDGRPSPSPRIGQPSSPSPLLRAGLRAALLTAGGLLALAAPRPVLAASPSQAEAVDRRFRPNVAFDLADASTISPSSAPPAVIPTDDRAGAAGIRADRDAAARARGSAKSRRAFSNDLARRKVATQPAGLDAQRPAPEMPAGGPTSHVADPALMPDAWGGAAEDEWGTPPPGWPGNKRAPVTAASPYAARRLSYTQLWQLVAEGKVASVSIDADGGGCTVALAASAPGGARTERVGLPYDPALVDHLAAHGVVVETAPPPPWLLQAVGFATQALFPMAFSVGLAWLVLQSLKIGGAGAAVGGDSNAADIFAGPELRRLDKGEAGVDFADVAGIDAVKAEVFEIVEFLRNPSRFTRVGARSPAGVLLAGVPGTGKTLLARAVAGEAGVPFFSTAGSDFMEAFVGMGASRVRDVFQAARAAAPCVLFIDEFDGIGAARTTAAGVSEESVQTINQLLTEMDGFDDNTGVIVLAATNRPAALDAALTRPGRFDRMIVMPLPSVQGRVDILKVHARGKRMEAGLDYDKVARATAGFTGAQLMGVMNRAAIMAVRRGAPAIAEEDVFAGLEDAFYGNLLVEGEEEAEGRALPRREVRAMAVYQAAKALVGGLTPGFDELAKVVACPGRTSTAAFVHWIPREEHLETGIMTRAYLEATLTVALAGRAAERLVYGEAGLTTLSGGDVAHAGIVARELVLRSGFGRTLGPACTTAATRVYVEGVGAGVTAAIESTVGLGSATAASAAGEIGSLMAAAEAKAHFILATNYRALTALADTLMASGGVLRGPDALALLAAHGAKPLATARVDGFGWDGKGVLAWPGRDDRKASPPGDGGGEGGEWTGGLPATRPPGTEVAPVGERTALVGGGPFSLPVPIPLGVGPAGFGGTGAGVDPLRDLPEAVAAAEARAGVGPAGGGEGGSGGGGGGGRVA